MSERDLNLRLRQNKGGHLWADLKRLLAVVLDREVRDEALVSVDETAALRSQFVARLRDPGCVRLSEPHGATGPIWEVVEQLAATAPDVDVVLLHEADAYTGAIRLRSREVLRHARRVWGAAGGDLMVATADASAGIYLGSYHAHPGDELEMLRWGFFAEHTM